jgi:hypothetical protein
MEKDAVLELKQILLIPFLGILGFLLRLVMSNEYFLSSVMICEKEMRAKLFVVGVFCLVIVGVIREL